MPVSRPHAPVGRPRPSLIDDCRGGMMLLGVFAAVFLCAVVFHIAGIGEAIAHRERMQDAADAAALASAVVHARGMNVLVLINLTMAALLATLVAVKLTETLAIIGIALATAIGWFVPPAAASIAPLTEVMLSARKTYAQLEDPVHAGLRTLHTTARTISTAVPALSQARVLDVVQQFSPPARVGIAVPASWTLPVENGEYSLLCDRAGELTGELVMLPLSAVGVDDFLSGPISDLTGGNADWFCGAGGSEAPRTTLTIETAHPELPARARCRAAGERLTEGEGGDPRRVQALCRDALAEERRSQPDPQSGECETDCGAEGAYVGRAVLARIACEPPLRGSGTELDGFLWQERKVRRSYVRRGGRTLVATTEVLEGPTLERGDRPPCGRDGMHDEAWQAQAGDPLDAPDGWPRPVCDTFVVPSRAREGWEDGIEVVHVLGCTSSRRETRQASGAGNGAQRDDDQVPLALDASARMGGEHFQLRAAVGGDAASGERFAGALAAASHGRAAGPVAPAAGRLAIAQAEFYFDAAAPAELSLWQMRWRTRLRRFRLDGSAGSDGDGRGERAGALDSACRSVGRTITPGLCDALEDQLGLGDAMVAH